MKYGIVEEVSKKYILNLFGERQVFTSRSVAETHLRCEIRDIGKRVGRYQQLVACMKKQCSISFHRYKSFIDNMYNVEITLEKNLSEGTNMVWFIKENGERKRYWRSYSDSFGYFDSMPKRLLREVLRHDLKWSLKKSIKDLRKAKRDYYDVVAAMKELRTLEA